MEVKPKWGLPRSIWDDSWGRSYKTLNGMKMQGQGRQSADNLLSSAGLKGGGRLGGDGERCLRHLESSIFLFLPNFVGAEFADR
jgi:hypothetical protein